MNIYIKGAEKATAIKTMCNNNGFVVFSSIDGNKINYVCHTSLTKAAYFDLKNE